MTRDAPYIAMHVHTHSAEDHKERVALGSIAASAGIAVAKLIAGLFSGSLALLSEAGHATIDTFATIMTYLAIRTANKPPDEEHQYGHGKVESLAALAETIILFVLATVVVIEAWGRLQSGGGDFQPTILAFAVLLISIAVDVSRVRILRNTAKETGSQALAADAMHFASDLMGSVLVLLGLGAAALGFHYGDALAVIGVAIFISIAGWKMGRRTIDTLIDRAPAGMSDRIRGIVQAIPGVVGIEDLRVRPGGTQVFGELSVVVSRTLSLKTVDDIKKRISAALHAEAPELSLSVNATPRALDDETILERVSMTAAHLRLPVHHVTVQNLKSGLSVSLDLEVDGDMSLAEAHAEASKLEDAIRMELGEATEVETHIEPLDIKHLEGTDAPLERSKAIIDALTQAAAEISSIRGIHDVRSRDSGTGLIVNFHCQFDPQTCVSDAHRAVDALERAVRDREQGIARIVGHAEPSNEKMGQ